jgi:hypothetical protein
MTRGHNYKMVALLLLVVALVAGFWESAGSAERGGKLAARTNDPRRQFTLAADAFWRLNPPKKERFDASGLTILNGKLLTVNDRGPQLYEIRLGPNNGAELIPTRHFPFQAVAKASAKRASSFDCEGLALANGFLYLSEESQRSIFRVSTNGGPVELLQIDWGPVSRYFKGGVNASFEGVAVGGGKLFVANERDQPRIMVVDLDSLKVVDSFFVDALGFALGGPHYSDLTYFEDRLFVLNRNHRCILEVNPATKKVEAEYSFGQMEIAEDHAYVTEYPTGTMEGLAVDAEYFWLVTDNNGQGRFADRADKRPTLFRCKRPGRGTGL